MKNLLITGGAGFIGSNFTHYCHEHYGDLNIIVFDVLTYAGNRNSLEKLETKENFTFIKGDICDQDLVKSVIYENDIDTIVHFAAESHVDRSIHGPDTFIQTNIIGTHILLKYAKQYWLDDKNHSDSHRFHHVSTDEVYGSLSFDEPAFTETTPYDPSSPYSASKAASDHIVRSYHRTYGLNITISNCSNNYGPFHFPEKLIPLVILNILFGKDIPVYGKGENVRDWLYVTDHCKGIDLILKNGYPGETYNIGGTSELNNMEVITTICQMIDAFFQQDPSLAGRFTNCPAANNEECRTLISFVKDRPGHDLRYAIDYSKINSKLNFKPSESFSSGIQKTIQWYVDNQEWWSSLLDDSYKEWLDVQYG